MGCTSTVSAALISRLGGQAVYDTDRNITWQANASASGTMTWTAANAWAAGLNIGGYTGWRLPTALNADGSGPCLNFNCTGSELGHLFYTEGGLSQGQSITSSTYLNQFFTGMQNSFYWLGSDGYYFRTLSGAQAAPNSSGLAWAVRTGDVGGGSVPEPGILGLMGIGALAWSATRSRRLG